MNLIKKDKVFTASAAQSELDWLTPGLLRESWSMSYGTLTPCVAPPIPGIAYMYYHYPERTALVVKQLWIIGGLIN